MNGYWPAGPLAYFKNAAGGADITAVDGVTAAAPLTTESVVGLGTGSPFTDVFVEIHAVVGAATDDLVVKCFPSIDGTTFASVPSQEAHVAVSVTQARKIVALTAQEVGTAFKLTAAPAGAQTVNDLLLRYLKAGEYRQT